MGEKRFHHFTVYQAFQNAVLQGLLTELPQAEDGQGLRNFLSISETPLFFLVL